MLRRVPKLVRRGFTIVELAVVIIVIAILVTITVVIYGGVQDRARATAVADGLKRTDDALQLWALKEGFLRWPPETVAPGGFDIGEMIAMDTPPFDTFSNYMNEAPLVDGVGDRDWLYDNDESPATYVGCSDETTSHAPHCVADDKPVCATTNNQKVTGVNIIIRWMPLGQEHIARMVNDIIDGEETEGTWRDCGRVLLYEEDSQLQIIYTVSRTKQLSHSD